MTAQSHLTSILLATAALLLCAAGPASALEPAGALEMPVGQVEQAENNTGDTEQVEPKGITVSETGSVNMHVAEEPLSTVLRLLSIQGQRNIITTPDVGGTVTADLYDVTFEEALDAILAANQCVYRVRGDFIYVYTVEELAKLAEAERPPVTRVFQLYYISAEEAGTAVEPLLSGIGRATASPNAERGVAPDSADAGGNLRAAHDYLVVHDYPERLERVEEIINSIDVRPQQVLVEATILRATLDDENALGVDFTILGGVDLELLGATSTGITNVTTGELPTKRFEKFNAVAETDFTGTVPPGGVTFGVIKDHVAVFIRALEQVTDTVLLANPKVLCLNKQKGQVIVGRRDGYLTTTVTETQAIQTIEFLETGTQLIFRPYIGKDGYVRMELHPEDSIGGLTASNLPFETTTELTTNIQCRDGQTILIGGLFREVTTDSRAQVPLLGDIPGLGQAFRSNHDASQTEEVIILLTVHIVKDDDAYAEESGRQVDDFERIRVGVRRGLMWHGRERLAQTYYHQALKHYSEGDVRQALWYLRLCLHNQPGHLSGIKLREEILQRREWEDEGSVGRDFVSRLILEEQGPGADWPRFGRPAPTANPDPVFGPAGFDTTQETTEQ